MAKPESNRNRKPDRRRNAASTTEADLVDQYQELNESQSQHEGSMSSLQQQIEEQREQTSQLRDQLESRLESPPPGVETGPVEEILSRVSSM